MSLRVPKERKRVVVFTRNHKIEGEMHMLMDSRVSDELNAKGKDFIPITNAKVFTLTGDSLLHSTDFITINKNSIDVIVHQPAPNEI
ncbi:MAG: hypothetical protein ACLFQV_08360 [Vulcanimicrobiota bacterium]